MRQCSKCGEERPDGDFNKHHRTCRACRATYQRAYVDRNREEIYARNKRWRDAGGRERARLAVYGLTVAQYERMLGDQGGVCAICKKPCASGRNLAVDHCHVSGKVRGLLCVRCNVGIGNLMEDPEILATAIGYLDVHRHAPGAFVGAQDS